MPLARIGSHPLGVWAIKHLVSPLDRMVVRLSAGRLPPPSSLMVPTLLLTTTGRRSGSPRTVPLVFVRDGTRYVVANARPAGERPNPWVLNLRAAGEGTVKIGGRTFGVIAHELEHESSDRWWPVLVDAWPAFADHYAATGERTVFTLEPSDPEHGQLGIG